jgi:hypothetical protein
VVPSDDDRDRQRLFASVALKVLGVALAIGLVIGIGTWAVVKSLGLKDDSIGAVGPAPADPVTPLPTTALPVPTDTPTDGSSDLITSSPTAPLTGDLTLSASPVFVKPMERINLTGQWPGHDSMGLLVQRLEGGQWKNFGVQTQIDVGTFATYVMTGHTGDQIFRVYDPGTKTASNQVKVTVG